MPYKQPKIEPAAHPSQIIRPEKVASKMTGVYNDRPEQMARYLNNPRLIEMLFFIQARSMKPGSLVKFARDIIDQLSHRIGTSEILRTKDEALTLEQKHIIWTEIETDYYPNDAPSRGGWSLQHLDGADEKYEKEVASYLKRKTKAELVEICRKAAIQLLPQFLLALCTEIDAPRNVWYMDDMESVLFEFMDRFAAEASKGLARTVIYERVLESLDRTVETQAMTILRGNSRFGKTEALKAGCGMWPGRMRLVTVPPSNSFREFIVSIAHALGMDAAPGTSTDTLRAKISHVLHAIGMFMVFDEGSYIVPQSFTRTTSPRRMNWIRAELFDQGLPVLIAVTPQWYDDPKTGALHKFVKGTNYAIEQFTGRCQSESLPDELEDADLIKVAQFHFPELTKESDLLDIASCALVSDNYLQTIENISKRARYIMRKAGQGTFTMKWAKAAIDQMFPKPVARNAGGAAVEKQVFNEPLTAPSTPVNRLKNKALSVSSLRGDAILEVSRKDLVSADS